MPYKIVFVDLGGVLVLNNAHQIGEYFEKERGLRQSITRTIFRYIQSGARSEEEIDSCLTQNGVSRQLWNEYVNKLFSSESRNDFLFNILINAKNKGTLIFYTSNNSTKLNTVLKKYCLSDLPDLIINSSLANVSKPNVNFWKLAFKEAINKIADIKKNEILVIDDSRINCESAKKYGFNTILYSQKLDRQIIKKLFEVTD